MTGEPYALTPLQPDHAHFLLPLRTLVSGEFPSLKARQLLRVLRRLGYRVTGQRGSHRRLEAEGRPELRFAYHDRVSLSPARVREILVEQAGLTLEEATKVVHDD
jgi:predicted RNA binding protein YcfA (HicA-like mRNA interferase family)